MTTRPAKHRNWLQG